MNLSIHTALHIHTNGSDWRPKIPGNNATFRFTDTNPSGTTYEWLVNRTVVDTGKTFQYQFLDLGATLIQLRVCNDQCCIMTTDFFNIGSFCLTGKEANNWIIDGDFVTGGMALDFGNNPPYATAGPNWRFGTEECRPVA